MPESIAAFCLEGKHKRSSIEMETGRKGKTGMIRSSRKWSFSHNSFVVNRFFWVVITAGNHQGECRVSDPNIIDTRQEAVVKESVKAKFFANELDVCHQGRSVEYSSFLVV